ncbi:MAG: hypothetical protein K0R41_1801 [Geminicoccaceae bacterium]|nr:hypothetical protein [Geminicoccaceae bacterium]
MGGWLRIANGAVAVVAGDPTTALVLPIEFPSRASATLFYDSPEHGDRGYLWLLGGDQGR